MTNNIYAAYVHLKWSRVEHVLVSVEEQPLQTETLLSTRLATAVRTMSILFFLHLHLMYVCLLYYSDSCWEQGCNLGL